MMKPYMCQYGDIREFGSAVLKVYWGNHNSISKYLPKSIMLRLTPILCNLLLSALEIYSITKADLCTSIKAFAPPHTHQIAAMHGSKNTKIGLCQ